MPPPRPCAGISWACASPASMPPPSRSASATSISCARSSRSRSIWTSRRRSRNGAPCVAPPWSTLPWPVLALMEEAVERGWAAFSGEEARRRGVAVARSRPLRRARRQACRARRPSSSATAFGRKPCGAYVSAEEARKRWAALARLPQGARPFPGDQRALQAQELVARTASRWRRSATSPIRWASAPTTPTPSRAAASSRTCDWEGDRLVALRRHRDRREVPAQLSAGAHAAEVCSRRGLAPRGARVPLYRDGREWPGRTIRGCAARRRSEFPDRLQGTGCRPAATPLPPSSPSTAMS